MEGITFHHSIPVQIRWNDVDKFGHVNNSVYFQYYDTAKSDYIATVCPDVDWSRTAMIEVHMEADFVTPIHANDTIAVHTAIIKLGHKSFTLQQEVYDAVTNELKCSCLSVMVTFDLDRQQSILIPEEWKVAIRQFEQTNVQG